MRLDKKFVEPCGAIPSRAFAGQMCSGTGCTLGFPTSPSPLVQACSLLVKEALLVMRYSRAHRRIPSTQTVTQGGHFALL
jgi:hypothetical protein